MDKTISISLGGFSFIIDEVAYNKLKKYLDQIRISLGNIEGVDEIMSDIEVRIAELFKERLSGREVVNSFDVEHVIEVMGEPEQYVDEDAEGTTSFKQSSETKKKKLYRDPKDKVLAGVLSGLAHYIGVETWIRSEEHTSELQSRGHLVCRLLLAKKKHWQHELLTRSRTGQF